MSTIFVVKETIQMRRRDKENKQEKGKKRKRIARQKIHRTIQCVYVCVCVLSHHIEGGGGCG
jgi:hypothetical protein